MQLTIQTTCRDAKHSNPEIGALLSEVPLDDSFLWTFFFISECFVFHLIVFYLNKRNILKKPKDYVRDV